MITTIGREIIRAKLPDKYKHYCDAPLTKGAVESLCTEMAKDDPDRYIDVLQDLNSIGEAVVSTYGRDTALSLDDLRPGKQVRAYNQQIKSIVKAILNNDSLTEEQKEQRVREIGYKYAEKIQKMVFKDADDRKTSLAMQINSGSRGNKAQLMQMMFGNWLMKDALDRDIPYLMADGYSDGASPMGNWMSASSARRGNYLKQFATGQAGYLGKQVTNVTHATNISMEDCGTTDTGVPYPADSTKNVGAVLLKPFHNHPAGSIVTDEMVAEAEDGEEMILRSPITCKAKHGICARCNGLAENGRFPAIGEYVPLNAARTYVEKITQGGLNQKHGAARTGKLEANKQTDPDGEGQPSGFRSVERMFIAQEHFPGGALLSQVDGMVTGIRKAPQGGHYISVGTQTLYAPADREPTVKIGDKVEAGDMLTDGVPNPDEVTSLRGLGRGRKYFVGKLDDLLRKNGWGVDRRNLEAFTKGMINKVRITDENGYGNYLPGDVADYDDIASTWQPHEDSIHTTPDKAVNKYLEAPVLYYNIGTRVTPAVAKELEKYQFNDVLVSDHEPPFKSEFMRPAEALQNDKHWLPRFNGERLQDALFDAARRNLSDPYDSPSFVDKIITAPYKQ